MIIIVAWPAVMCFNVNGQIPAFGVQNTAGMAGVFGSLFGVLVTILIFKKLTGSRALTSNLLKDSARIERTDPLTEKPPVSSQILPLLTLFFHRLLLIGWLTLVAAILYVGVSKLFHSSRVDQEISLVLFWMTLFSYIGFKEHGKWGWFALAAVVASFVGGAFVADIVLGPYADRGSLMSLFLWLVAIVVIFPSARCRLCKSRLDLSNPYCEQCGLQTRNAFIA